MSGYTLRSRTPAVAIMARVANMSGRKREARPAVSRWLTASQVGARLDPPVSDETVRRWSDVGLGGIRLPCRRRGRRIFFDWGDVEAFLARVTERAGK